MPDPLRCTKPACGAPAAARLTYDHGRALAVLDEPGPEGGWALCQVHADRLRVPHGWTLEDHRRRHVRLAS